MQIKAVKLYDNGFMTQALAFGGEGMDGVDPAVRYRSSLQNYVIDTGSEVILVDTGVPAGVPDQVSFFHHMASSCPASTLENALAASWFMCPSISAYADMSWVNRLKCSGSLKLIHFTSSSAKKSPRYFHRSW